MKILDIIGPKLANLVYRYMQMAHDRALSNFANNPENLRIEFPSRVVNSNHIYIGDDVSMGPGCFINAIKRYPGKFMQGLPSDTVYQEFKPSIKIGNRVSVTGYLTLTSANSVIVEDDVLIASHVFISDHSHGSSRVDVPYKYQPLEKFGEVIIREGCWIGEHVVIMPGVTVGKNSIIGANSVVTSDVPDNTIVVGSPAKVIKQWSDELDCWVDSDS